MMLRRTLAASVAVALLACGEAHAGTIIQSVVFNVAPHGAFSLPYDQLSPDLAPLNAVKFDVRAEAVGNSFTVLNTSPDPATFNLTYNYLLSSPAGVLSDTETFAMSLPGRGSSLVSRPINGGWPIVMSSILTTGLDRFVGTGSLTPGFFTLEGLSVDNPAIWVYGGGYLTDNSQVSAGEVIFRGNLTVTYYYGSTIPTPAPSSLLTLSLGLLPLAVLARRRRLSPGR